MKVMKRKICIYNRLTCFQRPERLFLSGEIDATKYGPPCLQIHSNTRKIIGSEDCLFLNVYTPLVISSHFTCNCVIYLYIL